MRIRSILTQRIRYFWTNYRYEGIIDLVLSLSFLFTGKTLTRSKRKRLLTNAEAYRRRRAETEFYKDPQESVSLMGGDDT